MNTKTIIPLLVAVLLLSGVVRSAAQRLEVSPDEAVSKLFKMDSLPARIRNPTLLGDPFYQGFMILGDGNFIRLRSSPEGSYKPLQRFVPGKTYKFRHDYLDYTASYPGLLLLIDKKSGDDPPEDEQHAQPGGAGNGMITVSGAGRGGDYVEISDSNLAAPTSPMIVSDEEKLAVGYSHHNYDPGTPRHRYYLKRDRIGAFPIAYKPQAEGKLLFFYTNYIENEFEYYDELSFMSSSSTTGTLLSYYGEIDPPLLLLEKMNSISPIDAADLSDDANYDPMMFKKVIAFDIGAYEANAYKNGGGDELRLFHLIRNLNLQESKMYHFVAALYDETSFDRTDNANYEMDMDSLAGKINLPKEMDFDGYQESLRFADAVLFSVEHGEPDDPNYLKIIDVCRCGDDYQVTFELRFCNNNEEPADGANIVLEADRYWSNGSQSMFRCFRLREASPEGALESCERKQVTSDDNCCMEHTLNEVDKKYCLRYPINKVVGGQADSCSIIRFTAIMNDPNINNLTVRSVMNYCVSLYKDETMIEERQVICGSNRVLNKEIVVTDSNPDDPNTTSLETNEIWESRDEDCEGACGCVSPFQLFEPVPPFLARWWRHFFNRCCK